MTFQAHARIRFTHARTIVDYLDEVTPGLFDNQTDARGVCHSKMNIQSLSVTQGDAHHNSISGIKR